LCASAVAIAMLATTFVPSVALADSQTSTSVGSELPLMMFKKKKKKKKSSGKKKKKKKRSRSKKSADVKVGPELSPEDAEAKRQAIRESVVEAKEKEQWQEVAEGYEYNATILGDPVTMMEGADARYNLAAKERSVEEAEKSIEVSRKALDMLYFYQAVAAGETESLWLAIDPKTASDLVPDADAQIARAEKLIEEIEAEQEKDKPAVAAKKADKKDKKKRKRKKRDGKVGPGTGLIAAGAALSAVGLAGAGMGIAGIVVSNKKQQEVEDLGNMPGPDPDEINRLDEEGKRANILGFAGLGIAVAGIAVGVPLIAIGVKKRREAGPSASASLRVAPMIGGHNQGFVLSGRF
jgi:hypothetical protein